MQFASLFKELCRDKGVTQLRALTDLGLTRTAPQNWKNGRPAWDTLHKMAEYFEVPFESLIRGDCVVGDFNNSTVARDNSAGGSVSVTHSGTIQVGGQALTEQETELLRIFRLMDMKERTGRLMSFYEWEANQKRKED